MLTYGEKESGENFLPDSDFNSLCQLRIDAISAVLDGDYIAALPPGYQGNGFAAVAAQREQKRVQFFVLCLDLADDVFGSFLCMGQIHKPHLIRIMLLISNG